MARVLARKHGANLVVVARRRDRLDALKHELEAEAGVQIVPVVADLARREDVDRVFEEATTGREIHAAVLNAGVTHFGDYHELEWEQFEHMLQVNVVSTVRLTTLFAPHLARTGGGLMMVSSLTGITPVAYQAAYSGTKAFLINFGAALHHELHAGGVSVTVFVPGGIQTEQTAGDRFKSLQGWLMPVEPAALQAVEALRKRRYIDAPGVFGKLGVVGARLLPQRFLHGRVAAVYRDALDKSR
jgi:hypothetical protein